jgi:hypothetical protein
MMMPAAASDPGSPAVAVPAKPRATVWTRASSAVLLLVYILGGCLGGYVLFWLSNSSAGNDEYAWAVSAIFVGFAVPLAMHDVHMHLVHYMSPLQRHFVRLIGMVPVYSITSWLGLVYPHSAVSLAAVRDLYEAYALWSFYTLIVEFSGGRRKLAQRLRAVAVDTGKERAKCIPPVCCMQGWRLGSRFVHRNALGLYQYVLVRAVVTLLLLIFESQHLYHEGNWSPKYFYLYAALTINTSQMYALWCLAYLYSVVHKDLAALSPFRKFLLVKGIVAITWWQSIFIALAKSAGLIPSGLFVYVDDEHLTMAVGNFAFCVEMAIAAVGYHYVYSYTDFFGGSQLAPVALLQRAEAEFDSRMRVAEAATLAQAARQGGGARRGGGGDASDDEELGGALPGRIQLELAPLGASRAVLDVLPSDMAAETGENIRTGFGLSHKWQKRARARRAELHSYADTQLGSSRGGGVAAPAGEGGTPRAAPGTPLVVTGGGSAPIGRLEAPKSLRKTHTKSSMQVEGGAEGGSAPSQAGSR